MYQKNSINFEYGWIAPDGNSYNTKYEGHSEASEFLCEEYGYKSYNYELELERRGWVKVTALWEYGILIKRVFCDTGHVTKKQIDKLFELNLQNTDYANYYIRISGNED